MSLKDLAPWLAIAVTLILSILVPLFTQIANNRFQIKMKKMDIKNKESEKIMEAYEAYFRHVGSSVMFAKTDNVPEAGASIQRLYVYMPSEKWVLLDTLFDNMKKNHWDEAKEQMKEISKWIAEDMKKKNIEKLK